MFRSLLGLDRVSAPEIQPIPSVDGIIVKAVVPINDETKPNIVKLLKHNGTLPIDDPNLLELKKLSLSNYYTRAASGNGNYIAIDHTDRSSAWYMAQTGQEPEPERAIILTEKRNGDVFQPKRILVGGEKATFAMIFEPPCCEDADSVLVCFNQGASFSWRILLSETALQQNVGNFFKDRVEIGCITDPLDRPFIAETIKHLRGIPCDCTVAGKFGGYREPTQP
jgi:hypothetical protein